MDGLSYKNSIRECYKVFPLPLNIMPLQSALHSTSMNTVDVCLISSDIDSFLVALTLDSSGFAGTLEVRGKASHMILQIFFLSFLFFLMSLLVI